MATLKLKKFPETTYIPLGRYAERVVSLVFLRDDTTQTYLNKMLHIRDEEIDGVLQSVVRDRAGRNWPTDASEIVVEYVERAETQETRDESPGPEKSVFDFNPRVADEEVTDD